MAMLQRRCIGCLSAVRALVLVGLWMMSNCPPSSAMLQERHTSQRQEQQQFAQHLHRGLKKGDESAKKGSKKAGAKKESKVIGGSVKGTKGKKGGKGGKSKSPSYGFDISNCASYSDNWLFELAKSCNAEGYDSSFNMAALILPSSGCKCPTAEALLANGTIECATTPTWTPPSCPYNCPVCEVCLVVSGCPNIYS